MLSTNTSVVSALSGSDIGLGDGGFFYTAMEPTAGTGVIGPASVTTFDETKALLSIYNGSAGLAAGGGGFNYQLRYIRLQVTTAGAGATVVQFTQTTDSINRYSSGGSALTVNNANQAAPNNSGAIVNFGALTMVAASGQRRVQAHTLFRAGETAWGLANETFQFSFGGSSQLEDPASLINNSTTLANVAYNYAPLVIGPGQSYTLHTWAASATTGITFLVELGMSVK